VGVGHANHDYVALAIDLYRLFVSFTFRSMGSPGMISFGKQAGFVGQFATDRVAYLDVGYEYLARKCLIFRRDSNRWASRQKNRDEFGFDLASVASRQMDGVPVVQLTRLNMSGTT
jgi:hypothetical protein